MENNEMKMNKFVGVGFFFNPATKSVLLHHRDDKTRFNPNKWALFGGHNKKGEMPKETFRRELFEELGIDISDAQIMPLCDYFNEEFQTHRYVFFVESSLGKSKMRLGEGRGFDWIPLDKVFEYDLTEKTARDLKTFLRYSNKYQKRHGK